MNKLKVFYKNEDFKFGFFIISIYLFWALFWTFYILLYKGTLNNPYFPLPDMQFELIPPFKNKFLFGTDIHGRSVAEIISMGLIYSIGMAMVISLCSATIGVFMGHLSVTGSRMIKSFCEIFTNVVFTFPSILIAIIIMSFFGSSILGLIIALVFSGWAAYARIARGEIKRILGLPYVEAAKALGMSNRQIFFSSVLPGIFPQLLVHMVLGASGVIISESALGFLGLGGSQYSWGGLLATAKTVLLEAPYLSILISLSMAGLIIGLNLLGDGLRDILDPHSKK